MKTFIAITAGFFIAACDEAYAQQGYGYSSEPTVATVATDAPLTAPNGMTLYRFDEDTAGISTCYDGCAANWPPLLASDGDMPKGQGFALVTRNDGASQWAKDGAPLYLWIGDTVPGDTNGDGVGGVWHIVR